MNATALRFDRFVVLGLSALILASASPLAHAAPPDATTVRNLVRQLAADELAVRDAAERELLAMGAEALELLPVANPRMPAEMRQRLERIREALEVLRAERATEASRVTLRVQDEPVLEVFKRIERQTGNRIVDFRKFRGQPLTNPPVSLEVDKVPFWQAVDQLLQKAKLTTYPYAIDEEGEPLRAVAVVSQPPGQGDRTAHTCYQEAFRFEPLKAIARRGLREAWEDALEVDVEVAWEPRLAPITLKLLHDSVTATDDADRALEVQGRGETDIELQSGVVGNFAVRFQLPDRDARQMKSLQGKISGLIPGRVETFRFADLPAARGVQQKKAGATVVLDQVRKNNEIWEVRILVRFESSAGALQSHLMDWVLENEVYLEDATGKRREADTIEKTREVEDEFGVAYLFGLEDDIAKYTLVYKTPAALLNREIPFRFTEIPLP